LAEQKREIFRREAIEALDGPQRAGDILRISPAWTRWGFWLILSLLATAAVFGAVFTVRQYAAGVALVRAEGRTDVTALLGGTVLSVEVQPGQRVAAGQVLVQFHMARETAEYDRIVREFELQLVRALRDPSDQAARQALTSLQPQKELAESRLRERTVRSPSDGVVSDIRIRPGQLLTPGETILSIFGGNSKFSVVALLPGQYRPMVQPGMGLRLELAGFQHFTAELTVLSIGEEVIGPAEAKRYLGSELGDALPLAGPVVLVHASLPAETFQWGDKIFRYYNGMPGLAEVVIKREKILVALIPWLEVLFGEGGA